jgi:hypothetical protein
VCENKICLCVLYLSKKENNSEIWNPLAMTNYDSSCEIRLCEILFGKWEEVGKILKKYIRHDYLGKGVKSIFVGCVNEKIEGLGNYDRKEAREYADSELYKRMP